MLCACAALPFPTAAAQAAGNPDDDGVRVIVPGRRVPLIEGAPAPGEAADAGPAAEASTTAAPAPAGRVGAGEMMPVVRDHDVEVMHVGGVAIRASDVFRELDMAVPGISADIVHQMVLSAMARAEAALHGIDVPAALLEERLESAIAEHRARFAIESSDEISLEEYVKGRFGLDGPSYRAEIRTRVLASLLLDRVVRFTLGRIERDRLQVILVKEDELARQIVDKLDQGASFAVLARRHSLHPSGPAGGDLPEVPFDAELALLEGRRGMQPGDVLGPAPITLEGQRYLRVLRLAERISGDPGSWEQRRDAIEAELLARPVRSEEVALFEARMVDRYRVTRPGGTGR